jgi:aspartyl-tRNA(Asn)/glutamyl-tRNA(Gln) amidotransferase subunit C
MTDTSSKVNLTAQNIAHVAKLAHLPLAEADVKKRTEELQSVLGYMSKIQGLNTEDVPEMLQISPAENTMREDILDDSRTFTQEQALANAPAKHNGYVVVPAIFGEV